MPQVIIVGAGPAGVCLSLMLVQRGIAVKLIEATRSFERDFRGEALMPSALDALSRMGINDIVPTIAHQALSHWEFWIEDQPVFSVEEPMNPGESPCTLVAQAPLLQAIIERAKQFQHFDFIRGQTVQELCWEEGRVVGVRCSNGQTYSADLVIGTDGRSSLIRRKADLAFQTNAENFNILWFRLPTDDAFSGQKPFCTIVKSSQAFGVFSSSEGQMQIGFSIQTTEQNWRQTDWAAQLIHRSPPWLATHLDKYREHLTKPVFLSVQVGHCQEWSKPGVLVIGDAAHPMSPIRAQGINMALRDVVVATEHLTPALHRGNPHEISQACATIQHQRLPEILRVQALQSAEAGDAEKLRKFPLLGHVVSRSPQPVRNLIKLKWLYRQKQLRNGLRKLEIQQPTVTQTTNVKP